MWFLTEIAFETNNTYIYILRICHKENIKLISGWYKTKFLGWGVSDSIGDELIKRIKMSNLTTNLTRR